MGLNNSEEKKKENIFSHSGPKHLTCIDWENDNHRMSVAACLVKGVYELQRSGEQADHAWWESFNFDLFRELVDDSDGTIFGAIYKYKSPLHDKPSDVRPPRYVVAFRGTLTKRDSFCRDFVLDIYLQRNKLHKRSRFAKAMNAVKEMVDEYGGSNVWIAGHSLGAAIAMLVGRNMAKRGILLQYSFLFNLPFEPIVSAFLGKIKSKKVKAGFRNVRNLVVSAVAVPVKAMNKSIRKSNPFDALSEWEPNIFVNPKDPFGSECVRYFEHREERIRLGKVDKLAAQYSFGSLMSALPLRKFAEPYHLIPSANLTVNHTHCKGSLEAHGINQWWTPSPDLRRKHYSWPTCYASSEADDHSCQTHLLRVNSYNHTTSSLLFE